MAKRKRTKPRSETEQRLDCLRSELHDIYLAAKERGYKTEEDMARATEISVKICELQKGLPYVRAS